MSRGCVPGPVISAVRRERPEDRLSLLEPIFQRETLAESHERPCRDLSARARLLQGAYLRGHAIYTRGRYGKGYTRGPGGLVEKSLEEWSISYECIPCKCAASSTMGNERLEEASRGQGHEHSAEPSIEYRVPSTEYRVLKFERVGGGAE